MKWKRPRKTSRRFECISTTGDVVRCIASLSLALLFAATAAAEVAPDTLFVDCRDEHVSRRVLSDVAISQDGRWRAYVQVDLRPGCLHTSRLWAGGVGRPYRLVYFIPPNRTAYANGMRILGWAPQSQVLLMETAEWQWGSDAPLIQRILAIDAEDGMVYEPRLEDMLSERGAQQCDYHVEDAGVVSGEQFHILVRARFFTQLDEGDDEADLPTEKRCVAGEQTWSFNFATGAVQQVRPAGALPLFKKSVKNPLSR